MNARTLPAPIRATESAEFGHIALIATKKVPQKVSRRDPCIGESQFVRLGDRFFQVDIWYQDGRLHHVGDPVEVQENSWL